MNTAIYIERKFFKKEYSRSLFPIFKYSKQNQNIELRSTLDFAFNLTEDFSKGDFAILPLDWSCYFRVKEQIKVVKWCEEVAKIGKPLLSFTGGDYGISVPTPENVILYRTGGYTSRLRPQEKVIPVFFSDPIQGFFQGNQGNVLGRAPHTKPVIGFCGMAPSDWWTRIKEPTKTWLRNIAGSIGYHPFDAQEVRSTSALRSRILSRLQRSKQLDTCFIIRQHYRAGAETAKERRQTTLEYYHNQLESDLNVCVRGGGNFSVRFYETLAMGRIPLFCDTDSPLPEIDGNWDDHIIRFTPKDIPDLPDLTMQWLKDKDMQDVFRRNRKLWEEQLSLQGFWRNELNRYIQ